MGWYVTCKYCKATEKYMHPACGCLEKRRAAVVAKIIGATVVDCVIVNNYPWSSLYTHYHKIDDKKETVSFYTETVIENGSGEYAAHETLREITEDEYKDAPRKAEEDKEAEEAYLELEAQKAAPKAAPKAAEASTP